MLALVLAQGLLALATPPHGAFVPAPGPDSPMPFYFSGTYCRASGRVIPPGPGPQGILSATLYINNNATATYSYNGIGSPPAEVILSAVFDSTQFAPGSTVTVRIDALDMQFRFYSESDTAPVANRIVIAEHHDMEDGAEKVKKHVLSSRYSRTTLDSNSWTGLQVLSELLGANSYFVSTHGNPASHYDDNSDPVYHGNSGGLPNYLEARVAQMGSGATLPPFNTTANPPVNIAYFYACNVGDTPNFETICYPYVNHWLEYMVNQAVLAYTVYVEVSDAGRHAELIYSMLMEGQTLATAMAWLVINAYDENLHVWDTYPGTMRVLNTVIRSFMGIHLLD